MNLEALYKRNECEIRAIKASAPIAASNIKTYVQTSETFVVRGNPTPRFQFRPNYGQGKKQLTTLRSVVKVEDELMGYQYFVNEPQDGTGDVVIDIQIEPYSASTDYEIQIIASGTSTGSFSML